MSCVDCRGILKKGMVFVKAKPQQMKTMDLRL